VFPQPFDHGRQLTVPLDRDSHPAGAEDAARAGQVADAEQLEVGLASFQIAAGPGPVATGGGADLEVGELTEVGGVLDGVGRRAVDHTVGMVEEQQLPIVRPPGFAGLRRPREGDGGQRGHHSRGQDQNPANQHVAEHRTRPASLLQHECGTVRAA
jgi:hypothetical protein